jgi:hypothetical protein
MNKVLTIVFSDEKSAYAGVSALHALDGEGSIVLSTLAVIKKNNDGTVSQESVEDDFPPPLSAPAARIGRTRAASVDPQLLWAFHSFE